MKKGNYAGALWEEMNERLKLIQEVLSGFADMQADIKHMKEHLDNMDNWHDIANLVIKDHSKTLNNHETRSPNSKLSDREAYKLADDF